MLYFATRFLTIAKANNRSVAYHFVANLLLYRKHRESFWWFCLCQALQLLQTDIIIIIIIIIIINEYLFTGWFLSRKYLQCLYHCYYVV